MKICHLIDVTKLNKKGICVVTILHLQMKIMQGFRIFTLFLLIYCCQNLFTNLYPFISRWLVRLTGGMLLVIIWSQQMHSDYVPSYDNRGGGKIPENLDVMKISDAGEFQLNSIRKCILHKLICLLKKFNFKKCIKCFNFHFIVWYMVLKQRNWKWTTQNKRNHEWVSKMWCTVMVASKW